MHKYRYALEKGEPKRLEVYIKPFFNGAIVKFDGVLVQDIPDSRELIKGCNIQLPDGSKLQIIDYQTLLSPRIQITRNGKFLPGSEEDPETKVKIAAYSIFLFGIYCLSLGAASIIWPDSVIGYLGYGWFSIIFGVIFIPLAYFTKHLSRTALIVAFAFIWVYSISGLVLPDLTGTGKASTCRIPELTIIIALFAGLTAINKVKGKVDPLGQWLKRTFTSIKKIITDYFTS